jgi:hypothetical protein
MILQSFVPPSISEMKPFSDDSRIYSERVFSKPYPYDSPDSPYQKSVVKTEMATGTVTEKEILNKMANAKKHLVKNLMRDSPVFYGKHALAVIHPPDYFNLPKMIIQVVQFNEKSSFGAEDWLTISPWLDTPKGKAFVPVVLVQNRRYPPQRMNKLKTVLAGTPLANNIQVFRKDEFQIQSFGNIFFVGWTRPIPLTKEYSLPPSCLLFEGYGKINSVIIKTTFPSGDKSLSEINGLSAFVTYFHPLSKYSGPGTDGLLAREVIVTRNISG